MQCNTWRHGWWLGGGGVGDWVLQTIFLVTVCPGHYHLGRTSVVHFLCYPATSSSLAWYAFMSSAVRWHPSYLKSLAFKRDASVFRYFGEKHEAFVNCPKKWFPYRRPNPLLPRLWQYRLGEHVTRTLWSIHRTRQCVPSAVCINI